MKDTHGTTHAAPRDALIIRGQPVTLHAFSVDKLTVAELRELQGDIRAVVHRAPDSDPLGPEIIGHLVNITLAAVRQQIPDIRREEVAEALDVHILMATLQELNGLKAPAPSIFVATEGNA